MLGIIAVLIFSYSIIYLLKGNTSWLLFSPSANQIQYAVIGLLLAIGFVAALNLSVAFAVENPYLLNHIYSAKQFFFSTWYVLKGVFLEELIFRGLLFYLLIEKIGFKKAIWISSVAFGIYHWFSYGLMGQPVKMLITLISTGSVGYVLGAAFHYSKNLYLPIALHFGYNFSKMILFSGEHNIGKQLFYKKYDTDLVEPSAWVGIPLLLTYYVGFQVMCYLYIKWIRNKETAFTKP